MFIAHEVAGQLVRSLRAPVEHVARHDASLADQLRRAGSSVLLNIAEGARRVGKDRTYHYRVAAGSAAEVDAALEVALAWGYVDAEIVAEARRLADHELRLLSGLTRRK